MCSLVARLFSSGMFSSNNVRTCLLEFKPLFLYRYLLILNPLDDEDTLISNCLRIVLLLELNVENGEDDADVDALLSAKLPDADEVSSES